MKDRQLHRKPETSAVPIISPLLHIAAMPALVFLRFDFGYLFLRPKSIFLSLIWAFLLFSIYSFFEPVRWQRDALFCWFLAASACLYVIHIAVATASQLRRKVHDQHSGNSWLAFTKLPSWVIRLVLEPVFTIAAGLVVDRLIPSSTLGWVLPQIGLAVFFKELINHWSSIRKRKQHSDTIDDATETLPSETLSTKLKGTTSRKKTATSRKPRQHRQRAHERLAMDDEIERHAIVLRMVPPYTLGKANENYRQLIVHLHPDTSDQDESDAAQLNEAITFFRTHFKV